MKGECPNPRPDCPYSGECFSDEHHLYFPRVDYHDIMGTEFRNLPENKEQICRWDHQERHEVEEPPEKPSREQMLGALATALSEGRIHLSKNKRKKLYLTNM